MVVIVEQHPGINISARPFAGCRGPPSSGTTARVTAVLAFVGALVAIVVIAVVVNRVRGARAHYLDAWTEGPGERRLIEDRAADFAVVSKMGQAKVMSFPRLRPHPRGHDDRAHRRGIPGPSPPGAT